MSATATRVVLAITGASGAVYGDAVLAALVAAGVRVELVVSAPGQRVARDELGHGWDAAELRNRLGRGADAVTLHAPDDIGAPIASGSFPTAAMIVAPCSMGSAGRIAAGLSDGLVERAADVHLKERRRLVLVVRETPFSALHLENLLRLARAGATVLPAAPGFYAKPRSIDDLVRFVAERTLAAAGLELPRTVEWKGGAP
ncbi:MAG TPA: UbiX family flavin prenyltransferase [Planctomycetota bacterium]|nr:UbiX family flavin prenyltransferase [Planctomycetota bacterium]